MVSLGSYSLSLYYLPITLICESYLSQITNEFHEKKTEHTIVALYNRNVTNVNVCCIKEISAKNQNTKYPIISGCIIIPFTNYTLIAKLVNLNQIFFLPSFVKASHTARTASAWSSCQVCRGLSHQRTAS